MLQAAAATTDGRIFSKGWFWKPMVSQETDVRGFGTARLDTGLGEPARGCSQDRLRKSLQEHYREAKNVICGWPLARPPRPALLEQTAPRGRHPCTKSSHSVGRWYECNLGQPASLSSLK